MKYFVFCLLGFVLCSCSEKLSSQNTDDHYRALIVGTWMQEEGDNRFERTNFSDGTSKARFGHYTEPSHDPKKVYWIGSQTNKWRIENGFVVSSDFVTNPAGVIDPKSVFRERIVRLDKEMLIATNPLTGKDDLMVRLPEDTIP